MGNPDGTASGGSTRDPNDPVPAPPRLVFGDDGSPAADVVWLWINNHRWPGWTISVLTARLPVAGPPVGAERAAPHPWEPRHQRTLLTDDDVLVEHLLAEADPRLALDSFPEAALVAVGPRGRGLLKALHIGSTTEWLISTRRPLAPLVVVRSSRRTSEVLVCVDGSQHARAAVETLAALPWIQDCRVTVLGVNDRDHDTDPAVADAALALERRGVTQVRREIVDAKASTRGTGARSIILEALATQKPDIVVLGARGAGGFRGLSVGSVAAAVVHHAPCSVLLSRAG